MKRIGLFFFAIVPVFALTIPAASAESTSIYSRAGNWQIYGDSPSYLDLGLGIFDATDEASGAARVEARFGRKLFFVGPALGLLANTDGGYFGYGALYADIVYKKLLITPLWGVGGYEEGDGTDLGGTVQFRSAITLSYQFDNRSRLGIQASHISNADLHDRNPGEEDYLLTFSLPF
jgi:hypothetical protein